MQVLNSSLFVAGRVYSLVYANEVEMVNKRELESATRDNLLALGVRCDFDTCANGAASVRTLNPLADQAVTVRRVSTIQAAGNETWERFKAKTGKETTSERKAWYHVSERNDCIVVHNSTGREYVRGLPRGVTKEEYFIGTRAASPAEVATIRAFKKSSGGGEREFVVLAVDNLLNVAQE